MKKYEGLNLYRNQLGHIFIISTTLLLLWIYEFTQHKLVRYEAIQTFKNSQISVIVPVLAAKLVQASFLDRTFELSSPLIILCI
jgi:hypothetical protein